MPPGEQLSIEAKEKALTSVGSWIGILVYCAFSFGMFYVGVFKAKDVIFGLITGFFALFGVIGLVMMVVKSIGQAKFGDVRLLLERPTPAIGGRLRCSLRLPSSAGDAKTLRARLQCNLAVTGEKGQQSEKPYWSRSFAFPVRPGGGVTLDIPIPADQPPTNLGVDHEGALGYARWELQVESAVEGLDFARSFDIEVGAPRPGEIQKEVLQEKALLQPAKAEPLPEIEQPEQDRRSTVALVLVNLIPIAGVAVFGWRAYDVIMLYWMENVVIGFFNVLRIILADAKTRPGVESTPGELLIGKLFLCAFFIVHYGAFCYGHGEFLQSFIPSGEGRYQSLLLAVGRELSDPLTLGALLAIVASHALSFFWNYLGKGEYRGADVAEMMFRPYKRIVVTHIFIIAGGFALIALNSQVIMMLLFVALKIGFDVYYHRKEHWQSAAAA